jgi:hypothetical protein
VPVVEPILALFQMQAEGRRRDAVELLEPPLGKAPEALNAVDVCRARHELVLTVMDSKMLSVPDINQSVVAAPALRVDDRIECDATAHNGLQSALFAVRHDLRIDASVTFEDAEDNGLTRRAATALATHSTSAEVGLINFDLARGERRCALAFFGDALSDSEKDRGHCLTCQSGKFGRLTGRQIERETAHELTEFTLANFGTPIVPV